MKPLAPVTLPRFAGSYKIFTVQGQPIAPAKRMIEILSTVMQNRVTCTGPHQEQLTVEDRHNVLLEYCFKTLFHRIGYRLHKVEDPK